MIQKQTRNTNPTVFDKFGIASTFAKSMHFLNGQNKQNRTIGTNQIKNEVNEEPAKIATEIVINVEILNF